ncbi:hypothetical protein PTTG_07064 [Puccinia triticina 1-1 BBBD Race 1]|uniref:Uncharacterized protein n=2 Tax=Puccinia triticina TaxID=208348 RepID=A0A180G7K8_PUCT1|nr:uncharacterized protein PtA15_10A731 [Puccinia triticina]OAV88641.1 hypothetical protein PTTG_07064 [Puccinia triticina 1-1 BBBD Race 1]WAQ89307.1 hypothetical protein PtA15_10A731 [Puccinia triticina]
MAKHSCRPALHPAQDMWNSRPSAHLLPLALGAVCLLAGRLVLAGHEFLAEPGPYHVLDSLGLSERGPSCSTSRPAAGPGRAGGLPADSEQRKHRLNYLDRTRGARRVRQKMAIHLEHVPPTVSQQLAPKNIAPVDGPHQLSTHPLPLAEGAVVPDHQAEEPRRNGLDLDLNHTPPSSPPVQVSVGHVAPLDQAPPGHMAERVPDEQPAPAHPQVDLDSLDMNEPIPVGFTPILDQVQKAIVNPQLRIKYDAPMKKQIASYRVKYPLQRANRLNEQVGDLPIYFEKCSAGTSSQQMLSPRIAKRAKPKGPPAKYEGLYQHPSMIAHWLGSLIKCVLFAHDAFLQQIHTPVEEQTKKHDSLIRWLNELVFSTTNHLPIVGVISEPEYTHLKQKGYTPAQKHLIYFLQGRGDDRNFKFYNDFITLTLIGIWYKREAPNEWAQHFQGSESTFWLRMRESMEEAKKDRRCRASKWVEQGRGDQRPDAEVVDFELRALQQGINPQGDAHSWLAEQSWAVHRNKDEPSEVEKRIISEYRRVLELIELKRTGKPNKTITDIPAKLHDAVERSTSKEIWMVRVIDSMSRAQTTKSVESRLTALLEGLRQYHQNLISSMEHSGIQTIPNAHNAFLDWFGGTILKPSPGPEHLSLFGYIYKSQIGDAELPLDETRFTPIQNLVLRFIAMPDRTREIPLTLLGYWYKKYQPAFWQKHFQDELRFGMLFKHTKHNTSDVG